MLRYADRRCWTLCLMVMPSSVVEGLDAVVKKERPQGARAANRIRLASLMVPLALVNI